MSAEHELSASEASDLVRWLDRLEQPFRRGTDVIGQGSMLD
ncbi:protein of unknown function [Candidatus Filomicrobium marinum]|uniref:Uncharacterized protein n=1 Tax=Candidatus Filomicrobium marinum TaxID=1608628 RepID=A0A0D6JJL2_9HYPH|nr:protein of unknown function [Candidatus Filomicrobium marinum]